MATPTVPEVRDLLVAPFYHGDSGGAMDLALRPLSPDPGDLVDMEVATAGNALRQALLLRLLTPQGSLAELGHIEYGSRLHELIGENNTSLNRQLARSYTLRALKADRRVEEVLDLKVPDPEPSTPNTLRIYATVKALHLEDPIELGIEVVL